MSEVKNKENIEYTLKPELTTRVALGVEYEGSNYCGWQYQAHSPSVQEALQSALAKIADHEVVVQGSGRTDTGVHALGQVVHFDTLSVRTMDAWVRGTNRYLPNDIKVKWAKIVPNHFNARYSALSRRYRYLIYSSPVPPGIMHQGVTWVPYRLDVSAMSQAASALVGTHDFTSYRATGCQAKSPIRTLDEVSVVSSGDCIAIDVMGNAFLHHMVRNIAGVLIQIGRGIKPVSWSADVLSARDRSAGGKTASPKGLYLVYIDYPEDFELPNNKAVSWFFNQKPPIF